MHKQRGSTIIEILIAVGIFSLVMTTLLSALTITLKNTAQAKARSTATKLARETIEVFRRERVIRGWINFQALLHNNLVSNNQTYCVNESMPNPNQFEDMINDTASKYKATECAFALSLTNMNTTYSRKIFVQELGNQISVTVTIGWDNPTGDDYAITLTDSFGEW